MNLARCALLFACLPLVSTLQAAVSDYLDFELPDSSLSSNLNILENGKTYTREAYQDEMSDAEIVGTFSRDGSRSLMVTQLAASGTNNDRMEWNWYAWVPNRTYWAGFSLRIDPDYQAKDTIIHQWKNQQAGYAIGMRLVTNADTNPASPPRLRMHLGYGATEATRQYNDFVTDFTFAKGVWHDVVVQFNVTCSGQPDGVAQVWVNDQLVFDYLGQLGIVERSTTTGHHKFGLYRNGNRLWQRVYHDALRRGANYDEVNPATYGGGSAPTLPAAPSSLAATAFSSSAIDLAWQDNATNEANQLLEYRPAGGAWSTLATLAANLTTYRANGLSPNTQYDFRVSASNSAGTSAPSNVASASTLAASSDRLELGVLGTITAYSAQETANPASKLIDGVSTDDNNRWSAFSYPQWVEIDLGQDYAIDGTILHTYQNRAYRYRVEARADGTAASAYATILDRTANTQAGPIADDFAPVLGRYVRLTVTGAHTTYTGSFVSIRELEILGRLPGSSAPADLLPVADAHVRGSSTYAGTNYGAATTLEVKNSSNESVTRRAFLRYDLTTQSGTATSAELSLVVTSVETGVTPSTPATLRLYAVANDTWIESGTGGITWNNQPAYGAQIATVSITGVGEFSVSITNHVNSVLSGDKVLSLVIVQDAGVNRLVSFGSREGVLEGRPILTLEGVSNP